MFYTDELTGSDPDGDIMDPVVDHNQTIKEQTDKEEPSSAESTPVLLQRNNNNELHQGDDFVQLGSVHIPTGGVGDVDEVNEERGSQYDLRDPAMHKMRSSLPVDAYGGMYLSTSLSINSLEIMFAIG